MQSQNENEPSSPTAPRIIASWLRQHQQRLAVLATMGLLLYVTRSYWQPLCDKEYIQAATLRYLRYYIPDAASWQSLVGYAAALAVWEMLGLATIPVETAAGMVFGPRAFVASLAGKVLGATLAFGLGRVLLRNKIQQHVLRNGDKGLLPLLRYNTVPPLPTALLMKFSVFPELLKNVGTAILFADSVRLWHFWMATALHGGLFTAVWTIVGLQAAEHAVPAFWTRIFVPTVLAVGVGLPPLLMASWARTLRANQQRLVQQ